MSVVINISKTYYKPIQTYTKLFAAGASEKENLAYLVGGCVISFVAQWPAQSRQAFINEQPVDELMGAILLSNLFLLPLNQNEQVKPILLDAGRQFFKASCNEVSQGIQDWEKNR